ncbi:MAG TPA: hypothetical protein V6D02_01015 [Candidatus Obscuribacterales bacterium]
MINLIIGLNVAIALAGFYLAWRLWQVKRALTAATVAIATWERHAQQALQAKQTPALMLQSRDALHLSRVRYGRLRAQLHQMQRIFAIAVQVLRIVSLGAQRWGRSPRRPR